MAIAIPEFYHKPLDTLSSKNKEKNNSPISNEKYFKVENEVLLTLNTEINSFPSQNLTGYLTKFISEYLDSFSYFSLATETLESNWFLTHAIINNTIFNNSRLIKEIKINQIPIEHRLEIKSILLNIENFKIENPSIKIPNSSMTISEDNSVLIEWAIENARFGITFEKQSQDSIYFFIDFRNQKNKLVEGQYSKLNLYDMLSLFSGQSD
ncbi:hypothetical protein [Leptospira kanakyensis]|uniref:hypothetical protein n=1 Tax=Leptospira kanakyensis TaxID=2484968 RepID=UPI00223E1498|nr:hypothetical protein [Leptospira kanakyensis]MCW7483230.1 hypothetical protein [Leptospira kanakyensis]